MKRKLFCVLIAALPLLAAADAGHVSCNPDALRVELEQMRERDQASRAGTAPDRDREHATRLGAILDECGWPSLTMHGRSASIGAFLVLQHADLEMQQRYLPLVRAADADGALPRGLLPLLEDRILVRQGKPQLYGSQFRGTGEPYPIADPDALDARRQRAGLEPLERYSKRVNSRRTDTDRSPPDE